MFTLMCLTLHLLHAEVCGYSDRACPATTGVVGVYSVDCQGFIKFLTDCPSVCQVAFNRTCSTCSAVSVMQLAKLCQVCLMIIFLCMIRNGGMCFTYINHVI